MGTDKTLKVTFDSLIVLFRSYGYSFTPGLENQLKHILLFDPDSDFLDVYDILTAMGLNYKPGYYHYQTPKSQI